MTAPKAAIQKGLLGLFIYLCNKNVHQPSRLNKQDEQGLSLLHHAAINNHPEIIVALLKQKMDISFIKCGEPCYNRIDLLQFLL
jgi:ankyrin repeat protein